MSSGSGERRYARRVLALVLFVSLCINTVGIRWGLPNDNNTWAADSLQPLAPMAVAKHVLGGEPWNSGWFYFKYPLGHPLLLVAAQAPYLVWLRVTGQMKAPASTYPYGFKHPERALTGLALVTRLVSALMGVGIVALAYVIASTLFGTTAGLCAAALVAGCYPIAFYAHTSNVDVPLLFWIASAVAAALWCAERDSSVAAVIAGVAVGMALLTKEQSIGALAGVPFVWLLRQEQPRGRDALRHAWRAAAGFMVVTFVVGNLWWNPMGFINRWRFLLGTLPPEIREKYAPYQFLVQVPKGFSLAREGAQLLKVAATVAQALTVPVLVLCLAGMVWAVWRRPRSAAMPLLLAGSYYVLSLRAVQLVPVRYTMPLLFFLLILGGAAGGALIGALRRTSARIATVLVVAAGAAALLPGVEIDRLLLRDPRYAAEAWLKARAATDARIEVYQPVTYLPRFDSGMHVTKVPVAERTVAGFRQRQPDLVVLSGGGRAGLTGRYNRDWQPGQPIFADSEAAQQFFAALRGEQLGYRRVGRFHTAAGWITPRINSVNPEISVFARE